MTRIEGELPENREELARKARFLRALQMFERGSISSGRAAELVGINRVDFLLAAGRLGVPVVQLDAEELERELGDD